MTESTGQPAPAAGWYADPSGAPGQRWWDGAKWTEHVHQPEPVIPPPAVAPTPGYGAPQPGYTAPTAGYTAPAVGYANPAPQPAYSTPQAEYTPMQRNYPASLYGAVGGPVVGPDTPVYNAFIWVIVLLPILSTVLLLATDFGAMFTTAALRTPGAIYTPMYFLTQFTGLALYGATVTLAYFDRRRLQREGFVRPFHWAWAFLNSAIYVIGRSVMVKAEAKRGLAPIWVWATLSVVSVVVALWKLSAILPLLEYTIRSGSRR